jgi:hypothetical protein
MSDGGVFSEGNAELFVYLVDEEMDIYRRCCEETTFQLQATVYTRQLGTQGGGGGDDGTLWIT